MRFKNKLLSAKAMISVKFLRKKIPLAVRWQITNRCTYNCKYCNIWKTKGIELTTNQIYHIIDELASFGTQRISFSGGEPLLRKDIGKILKYCKLKGISTSINTNGSLVIKKIGEIKDLDLLKLSLDGSEEIHDKIRKKGSYHEVIGAANIAKKEGIKFTFATTLTKYNIDYVDFILKKAGEFNTVVAFQPLKYLYRGLEDMSGIRPSQEKYKYSIKKLIDAKKKGNQHIRNSIFNLYHIYNWPKYKKLRCGAGLIFCMIETNGDLIPCDRINYLEKIPNCVKTSFKEAFDNMPKVHCNGCGFCGALELNHLLSFRLGVLGDVRKIM